MATKNGSCHSAFIPPSGGRVYIKYLDQRNEVGAAHFLFGYLATVLDSYRMDQNLDTANSFACV